MRWLFIIIMLFPMFAFAQVDTLQLVEIGSITAPSEIIDLYIEDLDADSLKEIILTTATNVHIYNGITYDEIWISPDLLNPTDLNFADINNDGLLDMSVKDNTHIYLFDPHTPSTIWTSPPLDSTYKCYTVGDRDSDADIDVVIVSKEPFSRLGVQGNIDTVWVEIYDYPELIQIENIIMFLNNYFITFELGNYYASLTNYPVDVKIAVVSNVPNIMVFTNSNLEAHYNLGQYQYIYSGGLYSYDGPTLMNRYIEGNGRKISKGEITDSGTNFENVSHTKESILVYGVWEHNYYIKTYTLDSLLNTDSIFSRVGYEPDISPGLIRENILNLYNGKEICFGKYDYGDQSYELTLIAEETTEIVWSNQNMAELDSILYLHNNYGNKFIVCLSNREFNRYSFYNGENGFEVAILTLDNGNLVKSCDVNIDNKDELISINNNSLIVYSVEVITGVLHDDFYKEFDLRITNHPNPFNASTTIKYSLSEPTDVSIEIYDILGRAVETLTENNQQPGEHQIIWNADNHPSGVYFYRIQAGDFTETKKMVLLR